MPIIPPYPMSDELNDSGPHDKDALIGYMAVMISIALENMRSNSFDESALEALKKAQAAYFSHVTTPKITKV